MVCLLPLLHAQHLVSVLLPQLGVDALVNAHGVHGQGNGQQSVHLLVLLVDLEEQGGEALDREMRLIANQRWLSSISY